MVGSFLAAGIMPAQEKPPVARRSFTIEFKTSAARLVRDQGYSAPQAARSLGVDVRSMVKNIES